MPFAFQVLGQIGVRYRAVPVELPAGKPQLLLAALLLNANRLVPVESLVDALWDESPPRSAVANVRTYAVGVRRLLADPETTAGSRLLGRERAYRIAVQPGELDLAEFTKLAEQGRASLRVGDPTRAEERLISALAYWREDHAGAGLLRVGGLGQRLAVLDDERLRTAEDLVDARLALNQHGVLIGGLRRTVAEHPLRERSWGQLMRALYRSGDVSGALRCFLDARTAMRDKLGVDPGPELCRLHAAMLARDPALDEVPRGREVREVPPQPLRRIALCRPRPEPPRQLPAGLVDLVGRDQAANRVAAAVDAGARIVSIYGPPGAGTSAFAVHAAHLLAPSYPDGQLFVPLGLVDPAAASAHLLHSLGMADAAAPRDLAARTARLRSALAGRRVLLLIDGVNDAAQVRPLLPAGPGCLAIVAGSRPLPTLDGATLVPLGPLPPSDAVAMLRRSLGHRVAAADPAVLRAVVDWCDGLPMALRIVAALLHGRPDRSLCWYAQRLREPQRRLDELRVQDLSIRESIAARCATVSPAAMDALRALAAMPGPVAVRDIAAASAVSVDRTQDALDELLDAQLVGTDGDGGYQPGNLVRLFASRKVMSVDV